MEREDGTKGFCPTVVLGCTLDEATVTNGLCGLLLEEKVLVDTLVTPDLDDGAFELWERLWEEGDHGPDVGLVTGVIERLGRSLRRDGAASIPGLVVFVTDKELGRFSGVGSC